MSTLEDAEVMAHVSVLEAVPPSMRTRLGIKGSAQYGASAISALIGTLTYRRVFGLGRAHEVTDKVINWLFEFYDGGGAWAVELSPADQTAPGNLREVLQKCGLALYGPGSVLMTGSELQEPQAPDLTVRRVQPPEARTFTGVMGWSDEPDPLTLGWRRRLVARRRWHHYVAFRGAAPVGCIAAFSAEPDVAVLWPVNVILGVDGVDRRGIMQALVSRAWRDSGSAHFVAEVRDVDLMESYRALGAQILYGRDTYVYSPKEGGENETDRGTAE